MENRGLLFIPDISGFTRFINESEIEHSRLIIQELLELLLNANQLGLEVSEIEGDAILFYKFGESPDLKDIYKQVEQMFCNFHHHLNTYELGRFCQCKACMSAVNLTLKIITHYGEFTSYSVKQFYKLIGKDLIVAHQLLKNDIEQHEYWLVTNSLLPGQPPAELAEWMHWESRVKQTEHGDILFHYTPLSQLKQLWPAAPLPALELDQKTKMVTVSREYNTDIITLFHATGDLRYRNQWMAGIKAVEEIAYILPRVGMRFQNVMKDGHTHAYYSSCNFHSDKIEFSETDEKKVCATYYTLEKAGEQRTKLTIDYYINGNKPLQLLFKLTKKKKLEAALQQSLQKLTAVVDTIQLPDDAGVSIGKITQTTG